MLPAKRQKIDRESTAAYIASQPLFDALRNATKAVADQKALLKAARDTVQALHVKVINGDGEQHQDYMSNIVTAWIGATEAYHDIFRQLALLTAEEPSVGRGAAPLHGPFVAMRETAREANELAKEVMDDSSQEDKDEVTSKQEESQAEDGANEEVQSDSPPEKKSSKPAVIPLATGLHKRPFVEDESAKEDTKKTPKVNDGTSENSADAQPKKKAAKNARARRKALKDASKSASMESAQQDFVIRDPAPSSPAIKSAPVPPTVEYEDVEAEAEARLKAKAAAKKARKAEKKRKRDSGDSFVKNDEGNEEIFKAEPELVPPTAKQDQIEKPKKKKFKQVHSRKHEDVEEGPASSTGAVTSNREGPSRKSSSAIPGVKPSQKTEKRKPDAEIAAVQGGSGKKRKTNHT